MELKLYYTNDTDNTINKTKTLKHTIDINLKDDTNIITPILLLNDKGVMNFQECNYCYVEVLNRYYFIRVLENVNRHVWRLQLEVDVLETYKTEILNAQVEIRSKITDGEFYLDSSKTEVIRDIDVYKSNVTLESNKEIILSTIGVS